MELREQEDGREVGQVRGEQPQAVAQVAGAFGHGVGVEEGPVAERLQRFPLAEFGVEVAQFELTLMADRLQLEVAAEAGTGLGPVEVVLFGPGLLARGQLTVGVDERGSGLSCRSDAQTDGRVGQVFLLTECSVRAGVRRYGLVPFRPAGSQTR
ncbi:hypothetical protein ACIPY6_05925 [Streptomyces sp. NPDC090054]|uniref:hypothetical protein n=1 Tax=Streptomyces sp. NPDC090054 TaxID=3365933 RepID=UPI0037F61E73